ncbi:hypothetical protein ABPG77_009592 [Micractinium sp. CCAP 211/92]
MPLRQASAINHTRQRTLLRVVVQECFQCHISKAQLLTGSHPPGQNSKGELTPRDKQAGQRALLPHKATPPGRNTLPRPQPCAACCILPLSKGLPFFQWHAQ